MLPGLEVPEIAAALGVNVTTVKTHLARIFEKTGVNRQTDLIALLMRHVPPIR